MLNTNSLINNSQVLDAQSLLKVWGDALVSHQIAEGEDQGGIFCPACGISHGRSADVIYPLMALFARTHDDRYRRAALAVFDWAERHVSRADGSWDNEVDVPWKGITCFSVLALGETLRHYGNCLTPETVNIWQQRLRRGADFLMDFLQFEVGDINYPISTAAALAVTWTLLGDEKYRLRARELAHFGIQHFTTNGLLWGEGPRGSNDVTPRGLRPIDVGYNVEESLPNLALYATLTGDDMVLETVIKSMRTHMAFLLPDGGWDAGWCARQYKWTYWGSRTSDGCVSGYALLRDHDARFATVAALNLKLLEQCTHDGLLYGGPHLQERGIPACIHQTFSHAKGLAAAIDTGWNGEDGAPIEQPRDQVREWPEAAVFQIVSGPWRASVTANDLPHTPKRGGYPSGGALSLLWHERTGPLCVASMNEYVRYEGRNMQLASSDADQFVLTPRFELRLDGELFSSLYDRDATLEFNKIATYLELTARGRLKNRDGATAPDSDFSLVYRCLDGEFTIAVKCEAASVRFIVPIVSTQNEIVTVKNKAVEIAKPNATVHLQILGSELENFSTERVFNFVPGVEALPLVLPLTQRKGVHLRFIMMD